MAATAAEAWARTGKVKQGQRHPRLFARRPAYAGARAAPLRAHLHQLRRRQARPRPQDMVVLCKDNFQYLGRFHDAQQRRAARAVQMAQEVIQRDDNARKAILEMQGPGRRAAVQPRPAAAGAAPSGR